MEIPEEHQEIYDATREVLEKLLELMDLPSKVALSEEFTVIEDDGSLSSLGFNIEGEDLGIIIGRRGQTNYARWLSGWRTRSGTEKRLFPWSQCPRLKGGLFTSPWSTIPMSSPRAPASAMAERSSSYPRNCRTIDFSDILC